MDNSNHIYGRGTSFSTSEPVESNPELELAKRYYKVFTTIEQELKDALNAETDDGVEHGIKTVLQVIEQHKADLYAKYNL